MTPKPLLTKLSAQYYQDGNTLGTTDDYESIKIDLEFQTPDEPPFVVIRTDGWSLDCTCELQELINRTVTMYGNDTEFIKSEESE